jgi:hypothetical protein
MLKRLMIFILLACVINTYFSRDLVLINFEMNQKKIAEQQCVNKDRPWMHCNGRCYLMKKLKQAENNESKQANRDLRSALQMVWFIIPSNLEGKTPLNNHLSPCLVTFYHYTFSNQYNASIFRPPKSGISA